MGARHRDLASVVDSIVVVVVVHVSGRRGSLAYNTRIQRRYYAYVCRSHIQRWLTGSRDNSEHADVQSSFYALPGSVCFVFSVRLACMTVVVVVVLVFAVLIPLILVRCSRATRLRSAAAVAAAVACEQSEQPACTQVIYARND